MYKLRFMLNTDGDFHYNLPLIDEIIENNGEPNYGYGSEDELIVELPTFSFAMNFAITLMKNVVDTIESRRDVNKDQVCYFKEKIANIINILKGAAPYSCEERSIGIVGSYGNSEFYCYIEPVIKKEIAFKENSQYTANVFIPKKEYGYELDINPEYDFEIKDFCKYISASKEL